MRTFVKKQFAAYELQGRHDVVRARQLLHSYFRVANPHLALLLGLVRDVVVPEGVVRGPVHHLLAEGPPVHSASNK